VYYVIDLHEPSWQEIVDESLARERSSKSSRPRVMWRRLRRRLWSVDKGNQRSAIEPRNQKFREADAVNARERL